ncbi:hypothetical protein R3P38DRAFT_2809858 [Favolaschia claudopus]
MASRAELPVYADSELSAAICEHHLPTTVGEQDRSTSSLLTQDPIPASSDHGHELQPVKGKGGSIQQQRRRRIACLYCRRRKIACVKSTDGHKLFGVANGTMESGQRGSEERESGEGTCQ